MKEQKQPIYEEMPSTPDERRSRRVGRRYTSEKIQNLRDSWTPEKRRKQSENTRNYLEFFNAEERRELMAPARMALKEQYGTVRVHVMTQEELDKGRENSARVRVESGVRSRQEIGEILATIDTEGLNTSQIVLAVSLRFGETNPQKLISLKALADVIRDKIGIKLYASSTSSIYKNLKEKGYELPPIQEQPKGRSRTSRQKRERSLREFRSIMASPEALLINSAIDKFHYLAREWGKRHPRTRLNLKLCATVLERTPSSIRRYYHHLALSDHDLPCIQPRTQRRTVQSTETVIFADTKLSPNHDVGCESIPPAPAPKQPDIVEVPLRSSVVQPRRQFKSLPANQQSENIIDDELINYYLEEGINLPPISDLETESRELGIPIIQVASSYLRAELAARRLQKAKTSP